MGGKTYYNNLQAKEADRAAKVAAAEAFARETAARKLEEERLQQEQQRAGDALNLRKAEVEKLGKSAVLAKLKDPDSAQFRNIKVNLDVPIPSAAARGATEDAVCGEVNSKNSFGGYGGYSPFIWTSKGSRYDGAGEPSVVMINTGNRDLDRIWELTFPAMVETYCK